MPFYTSIGFNNLNNFKEDVTLSPRTKGAVPFPSPPVPSFPERPSGNSGLFTDSCIYSSDPHFLWRIPQTAESRTQLRRMDKLGEPEGPSGTGRKPCR